MGTWGTAIFSDDLACDIRDQYRQHIEDGLEDAEALRATLERFRPFFDDPEAGGLGLLALAVTQSKLGRLDPGIRARALAVLDQGADLALWERENPRALPKRRAALEQARVWLTGPQPARKRLRAPRRISCGLTSGDALVLEGPSGLALLRVVLVKAHRYGETPILDEIEFRGVTLPPPAQLDRLAAKEPGTIAMGAEPRFSAFVAHDKVGWEQARFRKAGTFTGRAGDEEAWANTGVAWPELARRLRGD